MKKILLPLLLVSIVCFNFVLEIAEGLGWVNYIDEALVVILAVYFVCCKLFNKLNHSDDKMDAKVFGALILMVSIGILSNLVFRYQSSYEAIVKDMVQLIKFPLILYIMCRTQIWDVLLKRFLYKNILYNMFLVLIVAMFACGAISLFFDIGMSEGYLRDGMRSFQFVFSHPTYLVLSTVLALAVVNVLKPRLAPRHDILAIAVIAMSLRTKGFAFIVVYAFLRCFFRIYKKNKIVFLCIAASVGLLAAASKIMLYASYTSSPRESLYKGAVKIAVSEFPLGSGFGTFASSISDNYNSKVYDFIKIPFYYGSDGKLSKAVLGDAGLAYYVGQFGFIGIALFIYVLVSLVRWLLGRVENKMPILLIMAYLVVAIFSEAILTNCGMEIALIMSFLYRIQVMDGEKDGKNDK